MDWDECEGWGWSSVVEALVDRGWIRFLSGDQLRILLVLTQKTQELGPAISWRTLAKRAGVPSWSVARSLAISLWIHGIVHIPEEALQSGPDPAFRPKLTVNDPDEWSHV